MAGEKLNNQNNSIDKDPNHNNLKKKAIAAIAGLALTVGIGTGLGEMLAGNHTKAAAETAQNKTEITETQPLSEKEQLKQNLEEFGPKMEKEISEINANEFDNLPKAQRLKIADYIEDKLIDGGIYKSFYGTDIEYNDVTAEDSGENIVNAIQENFRIPYLPYYYSDNQIKLDNKEAIMCLSLVYYINPKTGMAPKMYSTDKDSINTLTNAMKIDTIIKYESDSGPLDFVNEDGESAKINIVKYNAGNKGEKYDAVIDNSFVDYTGKEANRMLIISHQDTYDDVIKSLNSVYGYSLK